jgi:mRNA interferase MazF
MPSYFRNDIILIQYPFSDLSTTKVRPAVIVSDTHPSKDYFVVPLTSKLNYLLPGEFTLQDWKEAGLNVPTAAKRGIYTIHPDLVLKKVGCLSSQDAET